MLNEEKQWWTQEVQIVEVAEKMPALTIFYFLLRALFLMQNASIGYTYISSSGFISLGAKFPDMFKSLNLETHKLISNKL